MIARELPAAHRAVARQRPVNVHHNLVQENLGNDDGGGLAS